MKKTKLFVLSLISCFLFSCSKGTAISHKDASNLIAIMLDKLRDESLIPPKYVLVEKDNNGKNTTSSYNNEKYEFLRHSTNSDNNDIKTWIFIKDSYIYVATDSKETDGSESKLYYKKEDNSTNRGSVLLNNHFTKNTLLVREMLLIANLSLLSHFQPVETVKETLESKNKKHLFIEYYVDYAKNNTFKHEFTMEFEEYLPTKYYSFIEDTYGFKKIFQFGNTSYTGEPDLSKDGWIEYDSSF